MKAFISYSFNEEEQYIATLLSYRLREQGFTLIQSSNSQVVDATTKYQIFLSQLFVGVVTAGGHQWQRVLQEYDLATQHSIPSVLLIEEGIPIHPQFSGNYVFFNRANIEEAIEEIRSRMIQRNSKPNNEALGWILGGAAVLGVIALLSNNSRK
ncbi:MAG TPA: hypothetical protein VHD83_00665 [Puia sp.]|nr:hypothetical protein [Puia sp.]